MQLRIGWIDPNGVHYELAGDDATYVHIAIANDLMNKGIIQLQANPEIWMEKNGWIKYSEYEVICPDSKEKEHLLTQAQINTICDRLGQKYMCVHFPYQDKYIWTQDLIEMNPWDLHYKLIS